MSFLVLIGAGALGGAALALIFGTRRVGCASLIVVPISAVLFVSWWQNQHPELLRSTSGLDYLFVPPIPTIGALVAYGAIFFVRDWFETRDL
ncbi:hypothetical protein [Erythrobacter sp. AP23]|uniref:hypothetical protein n=1 Tax=Erythrobacter sp. AP23 TaxID=499656 RepID=UPI00076DA041|nr:hypothetical protein [Erythrobacter sp. AP23]KWV95232.1 hypothetical protein ASS64_04285 [Erythrobacter sp. AP23]